MQNHVKLGVSIIPLAALFLVSCSSVKSPIVPPSDAPTVLMVVPQTSGVGTNRKIGVVFSKPMDPGSINSSTFVVAGVPGTVSYDQVNSIALFKSTAEYAVNTKYNASITTGAKDLSGTPLAAAFDFHFTTRANSDKSPPDISAVNVAAGATCMPLNQKISVTFDEQMDPLTIDSNTVFIVGVAGVTTYDVVNQIATFTPSADLAAKTTYTIMVTTGVKDMGEVPLAAPYSQKFTTGPCKTGIPAVALCPFIGRCAILAGSAITNTGSTTVSGDVEISPGTSVTGFPPGLASGKIHIADGTATKAQAALTAGYVDAAGRSGGSSVSGDIVGRTFTTGVYNSTSSLGLTGDVTLDAQGDSSAVFIFQIGSTLTTGSGSKVILANGAKACNVYWQVGSSATLGTNSVFKGQILALTSITITTGVNLEGRALARNGAVTLDSDVITGCTCP